MKNIDQRQQFIFIFVAAIIVDYIPYLRLPFLWSETFFHEISHGLMAISTGGSIHSLTLNYDGSGFCVSQGGVSLLVTFFGYFGSAVWGSLIYLLAGNMKPRFAHSFMALFILLLLLTLVLWAQHLSTYIILAVMITLFVAMFKFTNATGLKTLLQFIGIFVLLDAIRSPLALIDGQSKGDGARLAELTFIPELIWIGIWLLLAFAMLVLIYKMSYKRQTT